MDTDFKPEQIVCISHPDSEDRLKQMHLRFKSQGMALTLSPGVTPGPTEEKFIGCLRAHQNAIRKAKDLGLSCLVVFEDDLQFVRTWDWVKSKLSDVPDDYDIVRLSVLTDGIYRRVHIAGNLFRCWNAYGTQAYIANQKCFDTILGFPATDPYDDQLAHADLIEYALHPMPFFHELGTSVLGNVWQQLRDDFPGPLPSREVATGFIGSLLSDYKAPYKIQMRILQALHSLRQRANTKELRFITQTLNEIEVTRKQAIEVARALFALSLEESAPTRLQD